MHTDLRDLPTRILRSLDEAIVGKEALKRLLLVGLLAGGHVLIEGFPGTAKTTTAKNFARTVGGVFKRIQCAPDTLPADVTGFYLYRVTGDSSFVKGPVFANVVLADELNRTTPRTQAALLEAMQEGQVTVEGETHVLPQPYMVIASQIPYGGPGTYPLTGVQADRFLLRVWSDMASLDEERRIVRGIDAIERVDLTAAAGAEDILSMREDVRMVSVAPAVTDYAMALVQRIRDDSRVRSPLSARATIALHKCGRALAFMDGRDYVLPDDVKALLPHVAHHRLGLTSAAETAGVEVDTIVDAALSSVPVPRAL